MATRDDIITAYLSLSEEKGFSNVSLSDIAQDVGIRKASIYSHFESQSALTDAMVAYCQGILQGRRFTVDFKARDARYLLESLVDSILSTFAEPPLSSFFSIVQQQRLFDRRFSNLHRQLVAMVTARVRVALEYCVQRSWLNIPDTDIASDFLTSAIILRLCDAIIGDSDTDSDLDSMIDGLTTLFQA